MWIDSYIHKELNKLLEDISAIPNVNLTKENGEYLKFLKEFKFQVEHKARTAVVLGVFKAGKSTLLNALIGEPCLPSRSNRATGVPTRIFYSSNPCAWVIQQHELTGEFREPISINRVPDYILLNLSTKEAEAPDGVIAVEIGLPIEILRDNNWTLVDTPGLLDNANLTSVTQQELDKADLAIVVLLADKLLGEAERQVLRDINNLLNGNLIIVINRFDQIEELEDKTRVLEWAKSTLKTIGNRLVGYPALFTTVAKDWLKGNPPTDNELELRHGFLQILNQVFNSHLSDRVTLVSRLGTLNHEILKAKSYFFSLSLKTEELICKLELEAQDDFRRKQDDFESFVNNLLTDLLKIQGNIPSDLRSLEVVCIERASKLIKSNNPAWADLVRSFIEKEFNNYILELEGKIFHVMNELKMEIPNAQYDLVSYFERNKIDTDFATNIGGIIGSSKVFKMSRWLASNVGFDLEQHNRETVLQFVHNISDFLNAVIEKRFKVLNTFIAKYQECHQPKYCDPKKLELARIYYHDLNKLLQWFDHARNNTYLLAEKIMSFKSQFDHQWNIFCELVMSRFLEQLSTRKVNRSLSINQLINQVIDQTKSRWNNETAFEGVWLQKLIRENPITGKEFSDIVCAVTIQHEFPKETLFNHLERTIIIVATTAVLTILFWNQNYHNMNFSLNRVAYAFGIVCFAVYVIQQSKDIRHKKFIRTIQNQISHEFNIFKNKLDLILEQIDQSYGRDQSLTQE
uniref:Dynamin-type G domain-containing protein n=1 Tax=Cyanothece sp. (strain PCC 7425 / ATCC 29141) TaxID=395961 RepID=B8HYS7_CYAP4